MAWNSIGREHSHPQRESGGNQSRPVRMSFVEIKDINLGSNGFRVTGIVIAKESPKSVTIKNQSLGMSERYVMTMIIRDSVTDFISVSVWGKEDFISEIDCGCGLGSVITVHNPEVKAKQKGNSDSMYRAETSSPYYLQCSDRSSAVDMYRGAKMEALRGLRNVLLRHPAEHCSMNQILQYFNNKNLSMSQTKTPSHFTFFALVKKVGEPKDLLGRNGRSLVRCEVTLCDETCNSFPFVLWDRCLINEASQRWIPLETALSIVDCRVKLDAFRRGVVATADGKTIVVKDPNSSVVMRLKRTGQKNRMATEMQSTLSEKPSDPGLQRADEMPLESIHTIVNVSGLKNRDGQQSLRPGCVYGIVFAALTKFNIDSPSAGDFLNFRCPNCHRRVERGNSFICTSAECPMVGEDISGAENAQIEVEFNTIVHLTDHTGTDTRCVFGGTALNDFLRAAPSEFAALPVSERSKIKWQFMFNRFKVYFRASLPTFDRPDPFSVILSCKPINVCEALTSLK